MRTTILLILAFLSCYAVAALAVSVHAPTWAVWCLGILTASPFVFVLVQHWLRPAPKPYSHRRHIRECLEGKVNWHRIAQAQNMAERKIAAGWPPQEAANVEIAEALSPRFRIDQPAKAA